LKVSAIIQARMGSSRLPGKVMKKVNGKPLLEYQIERVLRSKHIDHVIVATTTEEIDNSIESFCDTMEIDCVRGSEKDVLGRYYKALKKYPSDLIIRLTSDCPLLDPEVVDLVITTYLNNREDVDYVSNTIQRSYPRGMDVEILSSALLHEINTLATKDYEREHVTPYIYQNEMYKIIQVVSEKDNSWHRWTVDTTEDFLLIQEIISSLYTENPEFTIADILNLFDERPELVLINQHIEQKKLATEKD
jgi:spore coat polysaccharide biosynthesis protein SpsF